MAEDSRYTSMENAELMERLCYASDDGAMYYMLFVRFQEILGEELDRYDIYDDEARYDVMMDFFFYLRDGERGDNPMPYASLMLVCDVENLAGWMWRCFRSYLATRYKNLTQKTASDDWSEAEDVYGTHIFTSDDQNIAIRLLGLVNRSFSAPERYVFFSDMYAMKMGKELIVEELSARLGCSPENLNVIRRRIKMKIKVLLKNVI